MQRTTIACGLTAVLLAGLAGAPSASATPASTAESASLAVVRAEQRRMLEQSSSSFDARLAEPQRIQECQSVAEGTDELDGTELDAEFYGLGYGCAGSTSGWLFVLQTRDLWADSALDGFSFNVELDGNPSNGCQGADRNVLGFYSTTSSQLVSGVYTTPSCDSATWTLDLASQIARSAADDVALAFDNAALGNPSSFQWTSFLTGVNESGFDFVPSSGTLQAVAAVPSVSPTPSTPPPPPNRVPALTVSPSLVKFGQTANVTISGSPGATVDLYTRKFQGEFTKIRDGLVLDSHGRTVVATKPDINLRFQAVDRTVEQGSSIGGADGLMKVEKFISLNIQKVSAGRYTFTGSINPTHPGATVNLYRNGTLWRSGLSVNSFRVYSLTANLASGTQTFQARTGTSGYNNASASPTRSISVTAATASAPARPAPSSPPARPADRDCGDFSTQAEAQNFFNTYYPHYGDVAALDGDGDRVACESLP